MSNCVYVQRVQQYDEQFEAKLPDHIFAQIHPGDTVVLKPNWVCGAHKYRHDEWEQVITHPSVISAVLRKVLTCLAGKGRVAVIDGPTTEAIFDKLILHYPVAKWHEDALAAGVDFGIIDLRDHEWVTNKDIVVERKSLPGDPRGKVIVDLLDDTSEFWGHSPSRRGYYGADYDSDETNRAHDGHHNVYSVSRTAIEADVFINLSKLKTHRKSGITCCLKNLVGINTYKNYLPHHSEGGPSEGGDQFPYHDFHARVEGPIVAFVRQHVLKNPCLARMVSPLNETARRIFGDTRQVIRSGNWYGNDTIWRMILDLNKILFYANSDGSMREGQLVNAKRYIGVVDAVIAGEGHGPLAPDAVRMGYVMCGKNPVAIDTVCASLMGFDPTKIPSISHSFAVRSFPLCDFRHGDIRLIVDGADYALANLPKSYIVPFEPQFGWKGHIELEGLSV